MPFKQSHLAAFLLATSAAACGGGDAQVPPPTTQTQASRQSNQPATVVGCLRAGDAPDTFVLTAAGTAGDSATTTYHLTRTADINLMDHVGKRVEVSGVVESQSQIATREASRPADNATGTAGKPGTPTVQTGTQLSIQRIAVSAVKPASGECGR